MRRFVGVGVLVVALSVGGEAQLGKRVAAIAAEAHGKVGVACSLPGTVLDCDLNAGARLPMQSAYKLPITMAMLHAVEQGKYRLDQPIAFTKSDLLPPDSYSPLMEAHPQAGVEVPLRMLMELTVTKSDTAASDLLLRLLGGPGVVDAYVKSLGVTGMQIVDSERTLGEDERKQYRDYAEPRAFVALLRRLADDSPFDREHTALLLGWMTGTATGPHRLKGALPPGTVVAHRTGTSGVHEGMAAATNDVGLITLKDGRRLAIAVMVSDSPASEEIRERVIAQIARAVWNEANQVSAR